MKVLVIGCGYSGARIAASHLARGDDVTVTVRDTSRHKPGAAIDVRALDLDAPGAALPPADRVYYTAPPPPEGLADTRLAALLDRLLPPRVFVYFGTTGVYGDHGRKPVNESASLLPATDRARRRLDAESRIRYWCEQNGTAAALLRIAAIYGPGRLPIARLRSGDPVPDPVDTGPGNRVHVDDLVAAALAIADVAEASAQTGAWNVSDGNPMSVADFNDQVARLAGLPLPRRVPLASPAISPGMRSFFKETRAIDNRKLLALPGFRLRFSDPVEGIRDSLSK